LIVGVFAPILKVKGLNFTNGVFMVNNDKLTEYFPMQVFGIGAYLG
jgi:Na+-transporting NADH:ubiquinone oxidoreductase subunit NqrE